MDGNAPQPQGKEQRILAAIVFTDVVGFSKLAAQNEARVYTALQRDMGIITSLCRAHSGQVLNTMGDGMLLCFTSAVDAMSCAVEIQRTLYSQSSTIPATDVLHHRIGVHLGDIIMSGDNVFGDGVNIAARLQAEAKPDGICFSKTVHEVIKNKLKIDAQYMAPRQLKNIGKVEIWQIPPIEEARQKTMNELISAPLDVKQDTTGAVGFKSVGLVLAVLICLGSIMFLVRIAANRGIPPSAKPGTALKDPNAAVRIWAANAKKGQGDASPGNASGPGAGTNNSTTMPASTGPSVAELQAKFDTLKGQFEFEQAAALLQGDGKTIPNAATMAQTFSDLAEMKRWMDAEVNNATASNKISCTMLINGAQTEVGVYRDPSGAGYMVETSSGSTPVPFGQLGAAGIGAIAQALISHPITNQQPKAQTWVGELQQVYPG
ncbi:MAG: adenylate/guanylate cyclase domain-containing protein [Fimbriimonas sp.]|nr:adenylate/guanylate cyclase domain-containing protein [Fimbriimonas sp.]